MRIRVGLCLLGLLSLYGSVLVQAVDVQPGVLIFCDDPSVEKAVDSAVSKFNEKMTTGHKLARYQILSASKSENGSDSVYSLQFTSRRSDCPAGSSKAWTECNYLPSGRKEPISCNATVYMTESEADTKQVDCQIEDYTTRETVPCVGCPKPIDENSEDLKVPILVSINKFNSMSNSTHLFTLHNVGHATRQVIAGFRYKLRFDMKKTICAKAEHNELSELCVADDENMEFANCNSTVDLAPWRYEKPQSLIECEPGAMPPMMFNRRRPAGWSPLRNILYSVSATSPPPSSTPATKEESSEEDITGSNVPVSTDVSTDAVNDNPFHCPSKSWKPFNLGPPAAPTKAAMEEATAGPSVEGAFSDTDLLG